MLGYEKVGKGTERKTDQKVLEDRDMSRQIPIFVEPGYEATFNQSRRSSDPLGGDTRNHHHQHRFNDTDRIEEEFEDASNRFFDKNFRRRHSDFPAERRHWDRDFQSHSPPSRRYQERPFRRGSNPSDFSFENNPSWKRGHFDEMIQRMMREDSDSFDFSDPEFGSFHVERTGKPYSPEGMRRKHEKVTKSPSAPLSGEKTSGKFDRQYSTPSTGPNQNVDDEGFVDIPVVVCEEGKVGKNEREKPKNGKAKDECVTQGNQKPGVDSECAKNEKAEDEGTREDDSEFTVKISVDNTEEEAEKNEEGKGKMNENIEKKAVESQENVESEKSTNKQNCKEESKMPQKSQQNAEMPQESQQNAEEKSQQSAEEPRENQQNAQLSKIKTIEEELKDVAEKVKVFRPNGPTELDKEYLWLEEKLMRILMGLDAIEANGSKEIRAARKAVVKKVQIALNELEKKSVASEKNIKS